MIRSINPTTGAVIASYSLHGPEEVDAALSGAARAQARWWRVPVGERVNLLSAMARELRAGKAGFARLITEEMGKPITESAAEIEKCAVTCDFYAEAAPRFLADETIESNATHSGVVFDPLGVVLAIMPWNYPFWHAGAPVVVVSNSLGAGLGSWAPQRALLVHDRQNVGHEVVERVRALWPVSTALSAKPSRGTSTRALTMRSL